MASRPPVTLLVMAVGNNVIFDPAKEELAVADVAVAVSVGDAPRGKQAERNLRLLSIRTIDPPSRLTAPGVPDEKNTATGLPTQAKQPETRAVETRSVEGVWKAPRGGAKLAIIGTMLRKVLAKDGVADEVLDGLEAVELG